ncbi:alpha/beta fold hydrolase [Rosistilla oblonga]|uniref:alpha/beta fold hydrolase n=1 Tax=Rosistilla oblonga TaxID=2527990 RepID=UPI003A96A0FE
MNKTVWRDDAARSRLDDWFNRFLERICMPVESRYVPSRYGDSHVLITGPADGPPLVCLHAMRTGSAFLVSELNPLLKRFRVIAPDLPGQSARGPQVRLSVNDDSYSLWLADVLDGLGLETVSLFGVSWGGFVARQAATLDPDRFDRLALLVPAGIVRGAHVTGLTKMALPMLRYRLRRSEANLKRLLAPLFTTWDDHWAGFTRDAVRDMPFDFRIPPLASDQDLQKLVMPVFALGAAKDICFPGEQLVNRICEHAPNCRGEVIPASNHCPPTTPEFRLWLADKLTTFFLDTESDEPSRTP